MKKFNKIIALVLALVIAIGAGAMPAFAAAGCGGCVDSAKDPAGNYIWYYNDDGAVRGATWKHVCSKGPCIFGIEDKRAAYQNFVKNGTCTVAYYMDANGDLWTDMPKYGGTLVAKKGTTEYDVALYGSKKAFTYAENLQKTRSGKKDAAADTTPFGFVDVKNGAWYADAVNALAHTGIINGIGNDMFDPGSPITWRQMYWILERLLGVNDEYIPISTNAADTYQIIGALMGWHDSVTPAANGTPVTRAEAVSIVATLYSLRLDNYRKGIDYGYDATGAWKGYWVNNAVSGLAQEAVANGAKEWKLSDIPDADKLLELTKSDQSGASIYDSTYGATYVIDVANILRAYTLGIVSGYDDAGTLGPADTLTRAQFCQMLYNAGVFGCVYPDVNTYACKGNGVMGNLTVDHLQWYMEHNRVDGTSVLD